MQTPCWIKRTTPPIAARWEVAKRRDDWDEDAEGGCHLEGGAWRHEFFGYQVTSGEIRVELTWFGVCTIGYEVVVEEARYESSYSRRVVADGLIPAAELGH